ncbi:branched-chain amino acid ABC transporter permease [Streptomyces narbonensis]
MRHTRLGLLLRAAVDNRSLTELRGVSADRLSSIAWMLSSGLAGLAGVLATPLLGLSAHDYTLFLFVSATAAVLGRFLSVPLAFAGGLGLGVLQNLVAGYASFAEDITGFRTAVPFLILFRRPRRPGATAARGGHGRRRSAAGRLPRREGPAPPVGRLGRGGRAPRDGLLHGHHAVLVGHPRAGPRDRARVHVVHGGHGARRDGVAGPGDVRDGGGAGGGAADESRLALRGRGGGRYGGGGAARRGGRAARAAARRPVAGAGDAGPRVPWRTRCCSRWDGCATGTRAGRSRAPSSARWTSATTGRWGSRSWCCPGRSCGC